jgi:hypothetical protein
MFERLRLRDEFGWNSKKRARQERDWGVKQVLAKRTRLSGAEYLLEWENWSGPPEWVRAANLNFCPVLEEELVGAKRAKVPPPRLLKEAARPKSVPCSAGAEWEVWVAHYLHLFQYNLRFSWRRNKNPVGRVRLGLRTWFPEAALVRYFEHRACSARVVKCRHNTNYVFAHPRDVPPVLVGRDSKEDPHWWRIQRVVGTVLEYDEHSENSDSFGVVQDGHAVDQLELRIVKGEVAFNYNPSLFRLSVSFDFAIATRSVEQEAWTVIRGGEYEAVDS